MTLDDELMVASPNAKNFDEIDCDKIHWLVGDPNLPKGEILILNQLESKSGNKCLGEYYVLDKRTCYQINPETGEIKTERRPHETGFDLNSPSDAKSILPNFAGDVVLIPYEFYITTGSEFTISTGVGNIGKDLILANYLDYCLNKNSPSLKTARRLLQK